MKNGMNMMPKMKTQKQFSKFLEECNVVPGSNTLKLKKKMKKEYVPLIEGLFKKGSVDPYVISNVLGLLQMTENEISEDVIKKILNGIIKKDRKYLGFIREIPRYLAHFKKKKYCDELRQIMEVHGTKEILVDRTESVLYPTIDAVRELGCRQCLPKLKTIAGYGPKINGRVLNSAKEAVGVLKK